MYVMNRKGVFLCVYVSVCDRGKRFRDVGDKGRDGKEEREIEWGGERDGVRGEEREREKMKDIEIERE